MLLKQAYSTFLKGLGLQPGFYSRPIHTRRPFQASQDEVGKKWEQGTRNHNYCRIQGQLSMLLCFFALMLLIILNFIKLLLVSSLQKELHSCSSCTNYMFIFFNDHQSLLFGYIWQQVLRGIIPIPTTTHSQVRSILNGLINNKFTSYLCWLLKC